MWRKAFLSWSAEGCCESPPAESQGGVRALAAMRFSRPTTYPFYSDLKGKLSDCAKVLGLK